MTYALITGASSGIGLELAKLLAVDHDLILVARRQDKLEELAQQLDCKCICIAKDLSDLSQVKELVNETRELDIEILINNAGFGEHGEFAKLDADRQIEMINLNISALTYLCHAFASRIIKSLLEKAPEDLQNYDAILGDVSGDTVPSLEPGLAPSPERLASFCEPELTEPSMRIHKNERNAAGGPLQKGSILNIASVAAYAPGPMMATYYSTKAYVLNFSFALAEELKPKGIQVSVACPGPTTTNFGKVAKVDKSIPFKVSMSGERVARIIIDEFKQGKTLIVTGLRNKLLVSLIKLMPRGFSSWVNYLLLKD